MLIGEVVNRLLTDDTAIAAVVGGRVYPVQLPQAVVYPAILYRVVTSERPSASPQGTLNVVQYRVQVDAWAAEKPNGYKQAHDLSNLIRQRLHVFRGTIGGQVIQGAFAVTELDGFAEQAKAYWSSRHYYIWMPE